eukprot:scaffold58_cov256-Pinguiococcus_pyrenoidosus.AAC.23
MLPMTDLKRLLDWPRPSCSFTARSAELRVVSMARGAFTACGFAVAKLPKLDRVCTSGVALAPPFVASQAKAR